MIYHSYLDTPVGEVRVSANNDAVLAVSFLDERHANHAEFAQNDISRTAQLQLMEYFDGKRRSFDLPLAPRGTEFQQRVWQALLEIDFGITASYLDVAKAIGNPKACRAVGAANGKNPIAIVVPCHRIIGSSGSLTGYAGGMSRKSFLLSLESKQAGMFF